ncbi:uncharacterized protein [Gossypium hirsutum]|uniref:Retrovirus-related Pol polyprotein from transposon TNT 1-94-like beta-barrel domain-containing protein n=1 Tax=Gossypium hirsutum TaxID=3635 RepID=A0A1U8JPT4_GOSHI|nr:uncharacterized protein LOC107907954 [Gossypium hirsutum]
MKDSKTIKQYADRIMATVNNIRLLGEEFSGQRIVEKVITTFLEKYEAKISFLEDSRDLSTIPLTELINALYAQEQRREKRIEDHYKGAFQARSRESSGSNLNSKGKKPWTEKKKKEPTKKKFPSCVHFRIGNGELLEAKGKGKAMISTKLGNKTISEVLYVPGIDQNLLSVGQLLEKGYSLVFESKICMIKNAAGEVLTTIAMQDRTFIVDVNQLQARAYASQTDEANLWHRRL